MDKSVSKQKMKLDWNSFRQVIVNLLDNSIKFSKSGKSVNVEVGLLKLNDHDENPKIIVSVLDKGISISSDEKRSLFKPFFTGLKQESNRMNPHGTGLGLAICKGICERALRGRIQIVSDE